MKTRKVEFFTDLYPGWQDTAEPCVFLNTSPNPNKSEGTMRVRVVVELPCFGGKADIDATALATSEVVKEGLQG